VSQAREFDTAEWVAGSDPAGQLVRHGFASAARCLSLAENRRSSAAHSHNQLEPSSHLSSWFLPHCHVSPSPIFPFYLAWQRTGEPVAVSPFGPRFDRLAGNSPPLQQHKLSAAPVAVDAGIPCLLRLPRSRAELRPLDAGVSPVAALHLRPPMSGAWGTAASAISVRARQPRSEWASQPDFDGLHPTGRKRERAPSNSQLWTGLKQCAHSPIGNGQPAREGRAVWVCGISSFPCVGSHIHLKLILLSKFRAVTTPVVLDGAHLPALFPRDVLDRWKGRTFPSLSGDPGLGLHHLLLCQWIAHARSAPRRQPSRLRFPIHPSYILLSNPSPLSSVVLGQEWGGNNSSVNALLGSK
jgi:hypothetical protein